MARIPISGVNDEALTAPGTDVREVISSLNVDGDSRVFRLLQLRIANEHASSVAVVEIYDSDESTSVTASTQRGVFHVDPGDTQVIDFPYPGLAFYTNLTAATTGGTIAANGGISASGYLE